MRNPNKSFPILVSLFCFLTSTITAQQSELNLSGNHWHCWLDKEVKWENDSLWLPDEVIFDKLPVNKPTIGWNVFWKQKARDCSIPASVEELFGTANDWTYHGVSWFYREFELPAIWTMKHSFLKIEQYNYRVEIYINEQLAGYDAIGMFPPDAMGWFPPNDWI